MARNAQDINPNDTYPRRNLPEDAEPWGRTLEDRQVAVEKAILALQNTIAGSGRAFDAATGTLTEQLRAVTTTRGVSNKTAGFGLTTAYTTVNSATIDVPPGFNRARVFVSHFVGANNATGVTDYLWNRCLIASSAGEGMFVQSHTSYISWPSIGVSHTLALLGLGESILLEGQAYSQVAGWAAHANNRSVLSAFAVFYNE